jgi:hypothetical protein
MDPFTLAAGITGILSLAIEVSHRSLEYANGVAGASRSWGSYMTELTQLIIVLTQIQTASQTEGAADLLMPRDRRVPEATVKECRRELELLSHKLSKTGIKKIAATLAWPFGEKETQKKVEMLHRLTDLFSLALSADHL